MASTYRGPSALPDPAALMQIHFSFAPSIAMSTGVKLGVFTHIAAGKNTAAEVAREAHATERGVRMLLDTLTAFELLRKVHDTYELTPPAAEYLVRGKPNYMGAMLEHGDEVFAPWLHLADVVRTGKPPHRVEDQKTAEEFFPQLVRSLHVVNREPARRTAEVLGAGTSHKGMRVLDVACGSGVWGIALAEADREARVTAQDYPGIFATTREYVQRHGVEQQYEFLPGDLKTVDFGEARYDVALLGNIVHSEGERSSRELFRRVRRASSPTAASPSSTWCPTTRAPARRSRCCSPSTCWCTPARATPTRSRNTASAPRCRLRQSRDRGHRDALAPDRRFQALSTTLPPAA